MKGKKTDSEFISNFILECVTLGIDSTDMMVNRAKNIIAEIDDEIRKVEKSKIIRSKMLDVVDNFEKINKNRINDIKILDFYKIKNLHICKFICDYINNNVSTIDILCKNKYSTGDILFCIKQLLEYNILYKRGNFILKGESFKEYYKFISKEY